MSEINEIFRLVGIIVASWGVGFMTYCLMDSFRILREIKKNR